VSDLVHAEALKLRTTRAWIGFLAAMLALTGAAAAGTVGSAEEVTLGTSELSREILSAALIAGVIAFVIGIVTVTAEWRHGTLTRTFLATPSRGRVLVAKELFVVLLAVAVALLGIAVVLAVAVPWLAIEGSSLDTSSDHAAYAVRIVAAMILWGALGVAVGSVVHSQTPALVGAILWILLIEALVTALLGLVDLEVVGDYLPGRALNAFEGSDEDGLSMWPAGAVGLGWVATLALLGHLRVSREDVT
jgi:ABC-2 type transport system permease protein